MLSGGVDLTTVASFTREIFFLRRNRQFNSRDYLLLLENV